MHKAPVLLSLATFFSFELTAEETANTSYIVNGVYVSTSEFPAFASLYFDQLDTSGLYQNYCGGTILDNFHVLTAAHCVEGDDYYATFTSIAPQLQNENDVLDGDVSLIRASEIYYPSTFVDSAARSWPDDIAIIKVASPMPVSAEDYVTLASLADAALYDIPGTNMITIGHGFTNDGVDNSSLLQGTIQILLSPDSCRSAEISRKQLCLLGILDLGSDLRNATCGGDSGGPLFWNRGGEYVQVGITSYGPLSCGSVSSDYSTAYTEVAEYRNWIANVLAGREAPKKVITESDRINFDSGDINTRESSGGGGSSGSITGVTGMVLLSLAFWRRRERGV